VSRDPSELESRLDALTARLDRVERRLAALERGAAPEPTTEPPIVADDSEPAVHPPAAEGAEAIPSTALREETLPLVGRTIVVLAGAFLLRALTERGILPPVAGTALGFVYAILWLFLADLATRKGRRTGAMFHGIASAIIAFPLIWEATVRFDFLSPPAAAGALLAVTVLGLALAWRRSLRRLAWVMTTGASASALVLAVSTRSLVLFVSFLLVLGFITLWLGWIRGWQGPGWLAALVVDLSIVLMTVMVLMGASDQVTRVFHPESLVTLQLALVLIYCGSLGARTLSGGDALRAGEIAQGSAALFLGLGGALIVSHWSDLPAAPLGLVSLVLSIACYAASFAFIDRRGGGRTNFIFYTIAALLFTLAAVDALLGTPWNTLAFAAAAVAAAWLGASRSRATLSLHGAVYATVAALTSGLLARSIDALAGAAVPAPSALTITVLVALAALAVCAGCRVATHGRTWGRFSRVPVMVVVAILTLGVDGLLVILVTPWLPAAADGAGVDAAALAVLRTGVLALSALVLARMARTERFRETSWLVYALLLVGAAKLLAEDLPQGRALTLFLSFALYGGALILAPRLLRRGTSGTGSAD
jgi:hypothetical protein